MAQRWHDLLFAHWPLEPRLLRPLVPAELTLEEWDGAAWIGVIPFRLLDLTRRPLPGARWRFSFLELNVRTYVRVGDQAGVYFFSLDASSPLAVAGARLLFRLPYHPARMTCSEDDGWITYDSRRWRGGAEFAGRYRPVGDPFVAEAGSFDHWLTERYCLYTLSRRGRVLRADIDHPPWRLQRAEAEIRRNTMTRPLGLQLPEVPPVLHFSRRQEVVNWSPERITASPLPPRIVIPVQAGMQCR